MRDRQREREEFDELKRKLVQEGHPDPEGEAQRQLQPQPPQLGDLDQVDAGKQAKHFRLGRSSRFLIATEKIIVSRSLTNDYSTQELMPRETMMKTPLRHRKYLKEKTR